MEIDDYIIDDENDFKNFAKLGHQVAKGRETVVTCFLKLRNFGDHCNRPMALNKKLEVTKFLILVPKCHNKICQPYVGH